MDAYEVTDLVNRHMTYRRGWKFRGYTVRSNRADHPQMTTVEWQAQVENSSPPAVDPRPLVIASGAFDVYPGPQDYVEDQILKGLQEAESHELREFFRIDGFAPYHPHRADGERRWNERTSK